MMNGKAFFLPNCALLLNNYRSIFVDEMLFFPLTSCMLMKIFSKATTPVVLLFSVKEHIFFSRLTLFVLDCCHRAWQCAHLKTNTSLAGCCRVPDIACCCDVDMRGLLIAPYLFFMMPDGASTDLITLVWHVNKRMRLSNVTTGMLQSQQ